MSTRKEIEGLPSNFLTLGDQYPFLEKINGVGEWKTIFSLPFIVLDWDRPCDNRQINKRKLNKSLLTCVTHVYMQDIREEMSNSQRDGSEFRLKYHHLAETKKEGCGRSLVMGIAQEKHDKPG
jgi:hypothetical protein